jgi:hypothetical protein
MSSQIQITGETKVKSLTGVLVGTTGVVSSLAFDVAGGVPKLDVNGKILVAQLPNSVMEYKGTWNAATNTPTLVNGTGNQGDVYLCNVAGTVDFGAGPIAFFVGDQVIYSGSIWQRASGATGTVTSVAITETGDSLNITGSPITTSGTINIGFNGTNLQYVNGAGNLTTFPTLITSIGLSMPSAFSVANSPLTANGTIAVTGAGVASQYIRGDGTLADFPSSGGGGSSVSYYLNGGTSQGTIGGTTYYEMSKTAVIGTGVDFAKSGDGFIVAFLTDANDPAQLNIPAGNWNYEIYASMSANGGTPQMYAELYKYDGTTFTLISTSSNEIIYDGTALNLYTFAMAVPDTSLTLTDRLAIKLYATNSGGKTTTIHTQDSHLCQVITTFSTGITALNGLTAQVQYFQTGTSGTDFNISSTTATHTFNIPDASATARGLITTGTQTIAGTKTFNDATKNNGGIFLQNASSSSLAGYMNLGGLTNGVKFTSGGGVSNSFTLPSATGYTFTFPNATGTLALTSDISYPVTSVFGRTGAVVATSGDYTTAQVTESGNLYFTDSRARLALSFVAGSGAYNSTTGVITIPTNNNQITNGSNYITLASLSASTGISYNNTTGVITNSAPDQVVALTASTGISVTGTYPNFTITNTSPSSGGTVTSVAALTIGTSGTDLSSTVATSTTTPVITLNVPTASAANRGALSSADWTTFNNKQGALTNPVTSSGGWDSNYIPKINGTYTIINSQIFDNGTNVGVGTASPIRKLNVNGSAIFGSDVEVQGLGSTHIVDIVANGTKSPLCLIAGSGNLEIWKDAEPLKAIAIGMAIPGSAISDDFYISTYTGTTWTTRFKITNATGAATINNLAGTGSRMVVADSAGVLSTQAIPTGTVTTSGSPTTNYLPKFTGASTIGNSIVQDNATGIIVNGTDNFTAQNGGWFFNGSGSYTSGIFASSSSNNLTIRTPQTMNFESGGGLRMTLTASGNLGLGVTPSAWASGYKAFQIFTTSLFGTSSRDANLGANVFINSSGNYTYTESSQATLYTQYQGVHSWYNAPTGTGNITFTQAMTLNAVGNLMMGTTTASTGYSRISLVGGESTGTGANTGIQLTYNSSTYGGGAITTINAAGGGLSFYTFTGNVGAESYSQAMTLFSTGNLLVQTGGTRTDNGYKLDVNGTGRFSGALTINGTRPILADGSGGNIFIQGESGGWAVQYGFRGNGGTGRGGFGALGGTNDLSYWFIGKAYNDTALSLDYSTGAATFSANIIANGTSAFYAMKAIGSSTSGASYGLVVLAGTTSADYAVRVRNQADNADFFTILGTGVATFSSSVTATGFFESSDSRLKTLIQDNYQTKGIASITPKLYTKNGKVELGYYAQDFVGILDSAVSKGSDDMLSLSYREVHTAKIYALEQEIKELKAKMN